MAETKANISPQQRAQLFAQATRQYFQMLPSKQVPQEQMSVDFSLPKTRLLSRILLNVEAVATLKSNAATIAKDAFTPHGILRRVTLDLNNGFSPFIVAGKDLYLYNYLRQQPNVLIPGNDTQSMNYVENASSAAGTDAKIQFTIEIPVCLNPRDPVGLIMLQNDETSVKLTVDVDQLKNAYVLNQVNNDSVTFKSMTITPMLETFSIPPMKEAFPDISVLKLVQSKADLFSGGGQNIVKLNVGTIYRKLIMYVQDADGNPMKPDDFNGNIELVFNQADAPYAIKPQILTHLNHSQLGYPLPKGVYVFDFSNQGVPNLGGSRDYIDTERLTEFWLRFSTVKPGRISIVSETLSRLR
ncbi:cytoplasmic protein [Bacillus toyonensis]|uniref:cytoplasmic protein n=1 Tax=Bacillus toyonensis TaxID=155322 RepID=UPI003D1C0578